MVCAVLTGCSTHRKIEKSTLSLTERERIMTDSLHVLTTEDMSRLISTNENLHIVIYDTEKPKDEETGKHPVKAELWRDRQAELEEKDVKTEELEETIAEVEHSEEALEEEEEKETKISGDTVSLMWWWIASAIIILTAGIIELKQKK